MSRNGTRVRAIALAGNPNVGKSSIFNALTGLHQHTGNWPKDSRRGINGTYSYAAQAYADGSSGRILAENWSEEERIAAEYLHAHTDACVIAVCDATCLARSLSLALQLMPRCEKLIVCVNLMDEAQARGSRIDLHALQILLGVPVTGEACASDAKDIRRLRQTIRERDGCQHHAHAAPAGALCLRTGVRHARQLAGRSCNQETAAGHSAVFG